ncbi:MAG: hypothetical protein JNJ84_07010 [Rhodobacteraceae bacterium]|nr:hypothetical protein [Paracoccaceae bacterium]
MSSRSERRVSVRLVATGGQALKAELVGIGQKGARALTLRVWAVSPLSQGSA